MTVIRRAARPIDNYTMISNAALRDHRLTYKARGLLAELLSHEPGWRTSIKTLASQGIDGKAAIETAVAELRSAGYLALVRERDEFGRLTASVWEVTDTPTDHATTDPRPENQVEEEPEPQPDNRVEVDSAAPDHPQPDYPGLDNRTHKKNNLQEDQHHLHHNGDAVAVDNSNLFVMTSKRQQMLTDVMIECGQAHAVPVWIAFLATVDYRVGEKYMRQWVGVRSAMKRGDRNRREDLNKLLALTGFMPVSEREWQAFLDATGASAGNLQLEF